VFNSNLGQFKVINHGQPRSLSAVTNASHFNVEGDIVKSEVLCMAVLGKLLVIGSSVGL